MLVYKVDRESHISANQQIKDMSAVLDEIYPTLDILEKLLEEHEAAFSVPSINNFRNGLKQMVANAKVLSQAISEHSAKMVVASEQADKHLANIDEHFAATLKSNTPKTIVTNEQSLIQ